MKEIKRVLVFLKHSVYSITQSVKCVPCCHSAYEEKEREAFAALESKARSDKNVMMSRLLHAVYIRVSESLSDAMVESPVGSLLTTSHPLPPGLVMLSFAVIDVRTGRK